MYVPSKHHTTGPVGKLLKGLEKIFYSFVASNLPQKQVDKGMARQSQPLSGFLSSTVVRVCADVAAMRYHIDPFAVSIVPLHSKGSFLVMNVHGTGKRIDRAIGYLIQGRE
jgi:hypothetical protein